MPAHPLSASHMKPGGAYHAWPSPSSADGPISRRSIAAKMAGVICVASVLSLANSLHALAMRTRADLAAGGSSKIGDYSRWRVYPPTVAYFAIALP